MSIRKNWKAEVIDQAALVKAVAAGTAPANLIAVDMVAVNAYARATRGTMDVPGIRFFEDATIMGR